MSVVKRIDIAEQQIASLALAYVARIYDLDENELTLMAQAKKSVGRHYNFADVLSELADELRVDASAERDRAGRKLAELFDASGVDPERFREVQADVIEAYQVPPTVTIDTLLDIDRLIYLAAQKVEETPCD
jgi:hypothetical protein